MRYYFYPYIVFLATFSGWSNFLYEKRDQPGWSAGNYAACGVLVFFCFYYGVSEIRQFTVAGWDYFFDAWNYLDILPIALVLSTTIWTVYDCVLDDLDDDKNVATVQLWRDYLQSLAALGMWFKFIYFLRCTDSTGWLVRMLVEVMKDMGSFLLVYVITILAFADAFYSMS